MATGAPPWIVALCAFAAILSLLATGEWPYPYYQFLRWAVCTASIAGAVWMNGPLRRATIVALIVVGVIFNPIAPFHMQHESWAAFNVIAAAVLTWSAISIWRWSGK